MRIHREVGAREKPHPIVLCFGGALVAGLAANSQFGARDKIVVPPEPQSLIAVEVEVTALATGPRLQPTGHFRNRRWAEWLYTAQYPELPFQRSGAMHGLAITPPMRLTLLVASDPKARKPMVARPDAPFTLRSPILVHGALRDGVLLADPQPAYDTALRRRRDKTLIGWAVVAASLAAAALGGVLLWRRLTGGAR